MSADAGKTLASAPIGLLITDMALAIADAQEQLDDAAIRSARKMAETRLERGSGDDKESFSLLELGFAPTFYSFVEADIELLLETRISEESSVGASVSAKASLASTTDATTPGAAASAASDPAADPNKADAGGSAEESAATRPANTAAGSKSTTKAVGMTMGADFQRKFGVETSGHTRITAKLVALPAPAQFLDIIGRRP